MARLERIAKGNTPIPQFLNLGTAFLLNLCLFNTACLYATTTISEDEPTNSQEQTDGPIRDIFDWDIDGHGRIGFLRARAESDETFVLIESTGRLIKEIPLNLKVNSIVFTNLRSLDANRWIAFEAGRSRNHGLSIWSIDASTGNVKILAKPEAANVQCVAPDHRGGFIIYQTNSKQLSETAYHFLYGEIIAFDADGNERWRVSGEGRDELKNHFPLSAGMAVTTDGKIVLHNANNENLVVFDKIGRHLRTIGSGEFWSCTALPRDLVPDSNGNVLITSLFIGPFRRIRLDEALSEPVTKIDASENRWALEKRKLSYPVDVITPRYKGESEPFNANGLRSAPDGRLWTCDRKAFHRLNESGVVEFTLNNATTPIVPQASSQTNKTPDAIEHARHVPNIDMGKMTERKRPSVPVVNTGRFVDQPLSDQQIEEILAEAEPLAPKGTNVWFIQAKRNQVHDNEPCIAVTVYFTPDRQTERIRYGSCFTIDTEWDNFREDVRQSIEKNSKTPSIERALSTYCQISYAAAPFDDALEFPQGSLLPFAPTNELSEQELIELVDFIRTDPRTPIRPNEILPVDKVERNAPIAFIRKTDDGYDVHMGSLEGPMSGIGQLIQCKKTEVGLEIVSIGIWVS